GLQRRLSRTCASVIPCVFSCALYRFSLPPKYCFLIWSRRASTCLSVITMPTCFAFSVSSARCVSRLTAWSWSCLYWGEPAEGKGRCEDLYWFSAFLSA